MSVATLDRRWPPRYRVGPPQGARWDLPSLLPVTIAVFLAAAAGIHGTVLPEHARESWVYGAFFGTVTALQLLCAYLVLTRPSRRLVTVLGVGSAFIIAAWIASRTTGLPVGPEPWKPESVGVADLVSTALEVGTVGATFVLSSSRLCRRLAHRRAPFVGGVATTTVAGILAVVALANASPAAGLDATSTTASAPLSVHIVHVVLLVSAFAAYGVYRMGRRVVGRRRSSRA